MREFEFKEQLLLFQSFKNILPKNMSVFHHEKDFD